MTVCKNCKGSIESGDAPGIGLYWFHRGRNITGSAYCGVKKKDWRLDKMAEPFDQTVYIVSREHKITQFGLDGMWFKIDVWEQEGDPESPLWGLVDIDDPLRIIYVPGFWCKEPFEKTEIEDEEPGIF